MTTIRWTDTARADLRAIYGFMARDSRVYGLRLVNRIKTSVERLRQFPRAGTLVQEWDRPDLREIVVSSYRVIDRIRDEAVEILAVIHAARQLPDVNADT